MWFRPPGASPCARAGMRAAGGLLLPHNADRHRLVQVFLRAFEVPVLLEDVGKKPAGSRHLIMLGPIRLLELVEVCLHACGIDSCSSQEGLEYLQVEPYRHDVLIVGPVPTLKVASSPIQKCEGFAELPFLHCNFG